MKLHGTLSTNLQDAIASANRLREHPVYPDTLTYWADLLREARHSRTDLQEGNRAGLDALIGKLESALALRKVR